MGNSQLRHIFATYTYSRHICLLECFIVLELKSNKKFQLYVYVANKYAQNVLAGLTLQ